MDGEGLGDRASMEDFELSVEGLRIGDHGIRACRQLRAFELTRKGFCGEDKAGVNGVPGKWTAGSAARGMSIVSTG